MPSESARCWGLVLVGGYKVDELCVIEGLSQPAWEQALSPQERRTWETNWQIFLSRRTTP